MNFLRNTLAVAVGLFFAAAIITAGIRLNPEWVTFEGLSPFRHWEKFLISKQGDGVFFWVLLLLSGIAAVVGGVAAAVIVKYAKVAYAILIGFILLFLAVLDVIIFPYHPTFYKIMIFLVFFPFSWIGGKITEVLFKRRTKRRLQEELKRNNP